MFIKYVDKNFGPSALAVIEKANEIITEYEAQGYDLTLRQLYYQFVSRDLIENKQSEYKKLGEIINSGRLAGLVSWEAIVDRTRNLQQLSHWTGPGEMINACAQQFRTDAWQDQNYRIEVWIEKDALAGVISGVCEELRVPYFSCRGYTSQSEMWAAGRRLKVFAEDRGQTPIIIHLGDHDPSGIDMSRDISDRLELFMGGLELKRIALNMDQVRQYNPPPNPAKITDTRAQKYIKKFGNKSWELDALEPQVLSDLIRETILEYRDEKAWTKSMKKETKHKSELSKAAKTFL